MNDRASTRVRAHSDDGRIFGCERDFAADAVAFLQRSGERAPDFAAKDRSRRWTDWAIGQICSRRILIAGIRKPLGIIVPTLLDPFYAALVQGIERASLGGGLLDHDSEQPG